MIIDKIRETRAVKLQMWQFQNVEKYQDLARKFRKMWVVRTKLIPVVMGDLGLAPMNLKSNLKVIGMCNQMVYS